MTRRNETPDGRYRNGYAGLVVEIVVLVGAIALLAVAATTTLNDRAVRRHEQSATSVGRIDIVAH